MHNSGAKYQEGNKLTRSRLDIGLNVPTLTHEKGGMDPLCVPCWETDSATGLFLGDLMVRRSDHPHEFAGHIWGTPINSVTRPGAGLLLGTGER